MDIMTISVYLEDIYSISLDGTIVTVEKWRERVMLPRILSALDDFCAEANIDGFESFSTTFYALPDPYWRLHLRLLMILESPCRSLTFINILVLIACLKPMYLSLCLVVWVSGLLVLQGENSRHCYRTSLRPSVIRHAQSHLSSLRILP